MSNGKEKKPLLLKSWCKDKSAVKKIAAEKKERRRALSAMDNAIERYEKRFLERVPGEYEAYVTLGLEVVNRAVQDYRLANERLMRKPDDLKAIWLKADAIKFFKSDWCTYLTGGIDGSVILERLEKEYSR